MVGGNFNSGAKSANVQFVQDVAAWTFQESQVLRVDKVTHFLANTTDSKEQYTTNDKIVRFFPLIPDYNPEELHLFTISV